ncbi:MAG: ABC transporter ATP-binding protein [Nitratireductor sp.]|jgi:glycerol transport system ATP-binding protein|nr:ABC transporter ATP-binding protein [Nitratireductor sp.]
MLELRNVGKRVGNEWHIRDVSMRLERGTLNVLLGPTLAGKTSIMRLMAGLDQPTQGDILVDGKTVLGVPVQKRSVAMVYQQFINYPSLTVYENIASPLRIAGHEKTAIEREVMRSAELLRLTPYLQRLPLSLSGGQQQRTALARAIVKRAQLVLLDEPLANLDYKLREELREELPKVFAESGAIFVYATTEASEALLLGGNTATLHEGRVTQFGPTVEVYRNPADLTSAITFSDPPLNTIAARKSGHRFELEGGASIPVPAKYVGFPDGSCTLGFRAHHLALKPHAAASAPLTARVSVTEITGSESFVHLDHAGRSFVLLAHGIHPLEMGEEVEVWLDTAHIHLFDGSGRAVEPQPDARAA